MSCNGRPKAFSLVEEVKEASALWAVTVGEAT